MANVEHSALTGASLHEPKGVAAAAVDTVYVADGAGSGTWKVEGGRVFGSLSSKPADSVAIATIGTTQKKLAFATTADFANGITATVATDLFTVVTAGTYLVEFSISFSTAAAGDAGVYEMMVAVDDVATAFGFKRQMSGTSDTGAASVTAILTLTAAQTVSIRVSSDEGGDTDDIDIEYAILNIELLDAT